MTTPLSTKSAASSGGVASSVVLTVSTTPRTGSCRASRISSLVTTTLRGRPFFRSRPRTSIVISRLSGYAEPMPILTFSAVCSPMSRLYVLRMCSTIAASIASPATRMERASTMPASEMTATSVVPPPMSTIMLACGSVIGSPTPMPAAMGSSIR